MNPTIPRRQMRRPQPVAGGIPFEDPLPILEHQIEAPALVWFGVGFVGGAIVLAGAAFLALAAWMDRTFG